MAPLEYELAYYNVTVLHVNYNNTKTPPVLFGRFYVVFNDCALAFFKDFIDLINF